MKKRDLVVGITMLLALTAGCKNDVQQTSSTGSAPPVVQPEEAVTGKVAETMDASGYTYVLVNNGTEDIWVAGPKTEVSVGDDVYIPGGATMTNFESKTLNRTFEEIIFASAIVVGGADLAMTSGELPAGHPATEGAASVDLAGIAKPAEGKSVAEVFADRGALDGKNIVLRGKVVKYMSGIMGKNWLHVKDGSGATGTDDLVVTTAAAAKVGDTVLVKGKVAVDKDFGSGYRYDVIIDDAEVVVE